MSASPDTRGLSIIISEFSIFDLCHTRYRSAPRFHEMPFIIPPKAELFSGGNGTTFLF